VDAAQVGEQVEHLHEAGKATERGGGEVMPFEATERERSARERERHGHPFIIGNEVSGPGALARGTSKLFRRLMPESIPNRSSRSSTAIAATARPTTSPNREFLPGTRARDRGREAQSRHRLMVRSPSPSSTASAAPPTS